MKNIIILYIIQIIFEIGVINVQDELYYCEPGIDGELVKISELDDVLAENISYTPMVYAVKNGEVIDVNDGYTEYSTLTQFLEDNGVEKK